MSHVNLEHADFRGADLREVNFTGSSLRYADFRGAMIQGANFQRASLYGAKLQGAEAHGTDFRNCDLRQAIFSGAYLEGAILPRPERLPSPSEIDTGQEAGEKSRRELLAEQRKGNQGGSGGGDQNRQAQGRSLPAGHREQQVRGRGR